MTENMGSVRVEFRGGIVRKVGPFSDAPDPATQPPKALPPGTFEAKVLIA